MMSMFYQTIKLFIERKGSNLAAASSFYVVICTVPLILLIVRLLGSLIGDLGKGEEELFYYIEAFFPELGPEVLEKIRTLVAGPLFGGFQSTLFNFFVLTMSSLSFFNSIWSGLFLITEDRSYLSFWRNLKGIVVIGVTILLMLLSLTLPAIFTFVVKIAQENFVVDLIWQVMPALRGWLESFRTFDLDQSFLLTSRLLQGVLLVGYFTFLYRWFFSWKIYFFNAFCAALGFASALLIGKELFLFYVYYVRESLIRNYGDFYTIILALMWVYLIMCFFFIGACLCHVTRNRSLYKELKGSFSAFFSKKEADAS